MAQQGSELLVYAVKGQVTAVLNKKETKLRIGNVLKKGTVIKTNPNSSLTMICSEGKPLQVTRPGTYPLSRWRDSCNSRNASVSNNYFKYIWQQLYAYSPESKETRSRRNGELAVSRGEPGDKKGMSDKFTKLEFQPLMDTVYYDGAPFPLSWTGNGYRGYYHFTLFDEKGIDTLFTDSVRFSFMAIDSFKQHLQVGMTYTWTVRATGVPESKKRRLMVVAPDTSAALQEKLLREGSIPEDSATRSFRVAYLLERAHYFGAAYRLYEEAARQNTELNLFRDQLIRFRNQYWIR